MFETRTEQNVLVPIWVKLSNLPMDFWSLDVFKAVGNALGSFLDADMSFLDTGLMCVARILVRMDMRDGLADILSYTGGP
jgi:hypothetical protein